MIVVIWRKKYAYLNCTYFAGGDDVQQLCEAGEAEFLEIMDLVGMASKPMHVRRLQKALQEWVHNPGEFLKHMPKSISISIQIKFLYHYFRKWFWLSKFSNC